MIAAWYLACRKCWLRGITNVGPTSLVPFLYEVMRKISSVLSLPFSIIGSYWRKQAATLELLKGGDSVLNGPLDMIEKCTSWFVGSL